MKKFILTEEEKNRILNLYITETKDEDLKEQDDNSGFIYYKDKDGKPQKMQVKPGPGPKPPAPEGGTKISKAEYDKLMSKNKQVSESINTLNEATASALSILKNPTDKILPKSLSTPTNAITLNGSGEKGKPEQLKYTVTASFKGGDPVNLIIKTFVKSNPGATSQWVISDAKPDCPDGCFAIKSAMWAMRKGQPDANESPYSKEGYNRFWIPVKQYETAINLLKQNAGKSTSIDAGFGVKINLSLAS